LSPGADRDDCAPGPADTVAERRMIRAFYAFFPLPGIAAALASLGEALPLEPSARLQDLSQLHMTIAFVGDVDAQRLEVLRGVGRRQRAGAMCLEFAAYEYWPKPEVVVAAVRDVPPPLIQFWETLHRELAARGFALTPKRLRPHVTLARKVAQTPVLPPLLGLTWPADSFSLVSSARVGARSGYTVLETWPLLDE
jgi:2'-5' RNA ligase